VRREILSLLVVLVLAAVSANAQQNALGLETTPEGLYRSFRAAKPNPSPGQTAAERARTTAGVDLSAFFPTPGYQGTLGSCVSWAVGYAVKSYQENIERGWGTNDESHVFSPSFIYNQASRGRNVGTSFQDSFAILMNDGIATWRTMPYTLNPRVMPSAEAFEEAPQYRAASFSRVNVGVSDLKLLLDRGQCVLVGMVVYANFQDYRGGVYRNLRGGAQGGHAMVLVGYDEERQAFKLINSWSTQWGEKGFCWIDYQAFLRMCKEAYVLYDVIEATPGRLAAPLGLSASRGAYQDSVQVRWGRVENAAGYRLYRKDPLSEEFAPIGQTRGVLFVDQRIEPETRYVYTVRAVNERGASDPSEIAVGWAAAPRPSVPAPPQNLTFRTVDRSVYLKWDAVEGASGYVVYRWDRGEEGYRARGRSDDTGFAESLEGIPAATVLHYIVTAYNEAGEGSATEAISLSTPEAPQSDRDREPQRLVPPSRIEVAIGQAGRGLVLSWDAVPGADWYIVLRWSDSRSDWQVIGRRVTPTRIEDPAGGRSDYYIVVSANRDGFSELSEYVSYDRQRYREGLAFDDVSAGYYEDPTRDTFFEEDLFSDDEVFRVGDQRAFASDYFDDGFFDDETVSRFYEFFAARRRTFEESRYERRGAFESFREERRRRFDLR
jgi:fibronectin type 3 domain-containing protein